MPWLSSSSGAVVVLILLVWWSKDIKPPSSWQQGSLFDWVGVLHVRVEDVDSLWILTWRGTYPLHPPLGLAYHDPVLWVVVSVMGSTIQWHQWAATPFPQPNVHDPVDIHTPLHITVSLHPSSVDPPVDVHGRSHNFPLLHPREVLLAVHLLTAQPLFSCGVIISSLPLEVGLHGVGLVHLSCAWWTSIHKGTPTSDAMRWSWFQSRMHDCLQWSITS